MPRNVSAGLAALLANPKCETHSTLHMVYSDNSSTERFWATSSFVIGGNTYTPYVKKIGDIKQSILAAADRVRVSLFNNDNAVCADVASSLRYFNNAQASVGRRYSVTGGTPESVELFNGIVIQPQVFEREVTFDIVDSLVAAGTIIGARPMTVKCPYRFKDQRTCGFVGLESTCNKMPNSNDGCSGPRERGTFRRVVFPL
jgi:hypothetical protein